MEYSTVKQNEETAMHLTRRTFLKTMSAVAGVAGINVKLPAIAAAAEQAMQSQKAAGGVRHVKSTCVHCVNFCGIEAKVDNGVIRAIYPDKARSAYYNWGICPKGVSGVFNTYNPYRLKKPLKRTNPNKGMKEDPKWVEISWEEAFDTIVDKLKKIKADNPHKLIWQHGHGKYTIGDQFPKAFMSAFGSRNLVHRTTTCEAARHVADELTWGYHGILPDLEYTNLYLCFGSNPFEGEQWSRWLDHAIMDGQARGMKMVVIEPRLSHIAGKADEWVPVRPGKDAVLILALARQLIDAGSIDEEFLVTYTNSPQLVGDDGKILRDKDGKAMVWDATSKSAKPDVEGVVPSLKGSYEVDGKKHRTAFQVFADSLTDITPAYAEEVCGVPAATVTRLAKEIAQAARIGSTIVLDGQKLRYRPVATYTFRGLSAREFGVQNWRAGLILNMLIGATDAVGGLHLHDVYKTPAYYEASKCEFPPTRVDLAKSVYYPHATHEVAQQVMLTLLDPKAFGLGYEPEMQFFFATNRPFSTSDTARQFEGLKKTFNVTIDIVMTETAWYSDIVLPDLTYLEAWHFSPTRWTPGTKHTAIRQPLANVYNIPHDAYSILWELAKRLDLRDAYIENVNKQWGLKEQTFQKGRDYSDKEAVEVIWLDKTKKPFDYAIEHGFTGKTVSVTDRYLKGVEDKFKGAGKPKMNFYAEQLVDSLAKVKEVAGKNSVPGLNVAKYEMALSPLPHKEHAFPTPHREAKDYPLYLVTHKSMYRNQVGNTALNPILNQALGPDTDENWVAINRATAEELGIENNDPVIVESRVGKAQGKAKLVEGIRPDTVSVSYHYGQWSPGFPEYARKGIWINQVLELHPDVVCGMDSFNDTKCKVYLVEDKGEKA
jgi:phenylacetyl-CoA:acceptor oxidoreductase